MSTAITIKEIAKECNVSPSTVSNVLNGKPKVSEETRNRIMAAIEKTGYQPNIIAQGLRRQRTNTIGIIVDDISQFTTPPIVEGAMALCEEMGYKTVVQNLRLYSRWSHLWFDNAKMVESVLLPAIQECRNIMVDGIIYIAGHGRSIVLPDNIDVPLVVCYAIAENKGVPSVLLDDESSAYSIIKYLVSKGHRKIRVFAGEPDNYHTKERILGIQRALFEEGILYDPDMITYTGWQKENAYDNSAKLLSSGATAVFCMNDRLAGGVYQYCYEHNIRVGEDISVAGFDNELISNYFTPTLTTMAIPFRDLGKTAAVKMMYLLEPDCLEDKKDYIDPDGSCKAASLIKLPARIVERNSVKQLK